MQSAIEQLRQISPEVLAVAVIGVNGELQADAAPEELAELLGPSGTTLSAIASRTAMELGRGALQTTIVDGSNGRVVAHDVGQGRTLVVVADPAARLGLLLSDIQACGETIARGGRDA